MMTKRPIDRSKAVLKRAGFQFAPFRPRAGKSLQSSGLPPDTDILVIARQGERHAFTMREMAYHHIAQGEIAGEPYLVSF